MPALTRRRYTERQDCWHVYYGDVHVGTIAVRAGIPFDEDPWEWSVGFYPGSRPHSQVPTTMMGCPCGARFDCHDPAGSYEHRRHIHAAERLMRV
jgi:hypothetical protein